MSLTSAGPGGPTTGIGRRIQVRSARLYLVSDDSTSDGELLGLLAAAISGGADIFQLRRKGIEPTDLDALAFRCAEICHQAGVLFIVDDHLELALRSGADGVHLGHEDTPLVEARRLLGSELLIGASTHDREQVLSAVRDGADYISAGPVNATPTKAGRPAVGLGHVSDAARYTTVPVVAIGGLDATGAAAAVERGADMVGVVRAVCASADPADASATIRRVVEGAAAWSWMWINGTMRKCPPHEPLDELARSLNLDGNGVVIEVNGTIPPRDEWAGIRLEPGDRLEVVHFVGGGSLD
ncbi:MAG TPA: thiamine phosphate synthase [Candidatus Dormibacteraeota bacterium]|nr:thiamine phosphate synthase [Candidatus Dormibacteraeota bacterium]